MSRSSRPEGPSWRFLRARRGQTEPIAALVAVLAVGVALGLYAGAAADALPSSERSDATPAMERLASEAITDGTVDPVALPDPDRLAPAGQNASVTLRYDCVERRYGPAPPRGADSETRSVAIRIAPGDRRTGELTVEVWS